MWELKSVLRVLGTVAMIIAVGCSGDSTTRRHANPASGTAGTGSTGTAGFGPGPGGGGGTAGTGNVVGDPGPRTSTPFERDDTGMSGLDAATIDALRKGGTMCSTELQYPYDGTIFPSGIISPLFMWKGKADASYVNVSYDGDPGLVKYEYAAKGTDPGELRIPQDAWNEIGRRAGSAALIVKMSVQAGGAISTCEHRLGMAPGVMKGTIYYNTYAAPGARNLSQGAVMRVTVGQVDPQIYVQYNGAEMVMSGTGPCISCHSVSANGTTMVASLHNYAVSYGGGGGGQYYMPPGGGGTTMSGKSFKAYVYPVGAQAEPPDTGELPNAEFSALYPDGSRVLTMGSPQCTGGSDTFPRAPNNFPLVEGPDNAKVLDTKTGMEIPATGLNKDWYMWMPQFSPDGKHVAFNHAKPDGKGGTDRRELAVMDYDYASNTFSNLRVVVSHLGPEPSLNYMPAPAGAGATPAGIGGCMKPMEQSDVAALPNGSCTGPCYPGFPFFTPDSKGIIFSMVSEPDFTSAFPGRDAPSKSDLWYVDVASAKSIKLEKAGASLDPNDSLMNYFPTVLPVQVGGYYWMFWTSRRSWGTKLDATAAITSLPFLPPGITLPGGLEATKKRIWVSAIRPPAAGGDVVGELSDPSAPGFYLEGQSESGNVRAFATLAPCVAAGTACTSGLDCCTGFCSIPEGGSEGTCTEDVPMCSKTNEKCSTNDDCCPPGPDEIQNICLGGFCGFVVPE